MRDPHQTATFSYARLIMDGDFRAKFPWVRNAIICVVDDPVDQVLADRAGTYYPDGNATIACYYPNEHRMRFIQVLDKNVDHSGRPGPHGTLRSSRQSNLKVGDLFAAVYQDPTLGFNLFGEYSTMKAEAELTSV